MQETHKITVTKKTHKNNRLTSARHSRDLKHGLRYVYPICEIHNRLLDLKVKGFMRVTRQVSDN